MISDTLEGLGEHRHDVCVIGSGPVGIALALELERLGRTVLVLESGGLTAEPEAQSLSNAHIVDPARHDDMRIAVARRLGGTSNLWGGRCLPYDPIDFEPRVVVGGAKIASSPQIAATPRIVRLLLTVPPRNESRRRNVNAAMLQPR